MAMIGSFAKRGVRADLHRGLVAVHHRHLQIHQHHVEARSARREQVVHRLLAVVGDVDRRADAFEQFHGDLLVDLVVFGQQNPRAAQSARVAVVRAGVRPFRPSRARTASPACPPAWTGDRLDQKAVDAQPLGLLAHLFAAERGDHDDRRLVA